MDKIRLLLGRGYFPVQLPPGFTTTSFAKRYKAVSALWPTGQKRNSPERFSVARSSYNRRVTSILNPVSYFHLCQAVAIYWAKIQNHFSRSKFSFSRPKLERGLRAIKINRFSDVHDHKILAASGYRYTLVTDISRFFPTIYTHSIPWALHGKAIAKTQRAKVPHYFGNILDANSMAIQDFQTMGLPIGPDTSHVIAEIVGTAIDRELKAELGVWPAGFRYVDDFYLFFNKCEEAERALSILARVVGGYELQINAQKTRIIETKELIEESWKYKLKGMAIAESRAAQRNDIHKFFENLLGLEKSYRDESVVKYGLKIISSKVIKRSNWRIFESYLLHCGFSFPNTLQVIASFLTTYARYGYDLNREAIARFCNTTVSVHAPSDNHSEVAWALWILLELELPLNHDAVQALERISSSACLLLALAVLNSRANGPTFSVGKLSPYATTDALFGDGWLLAYEGGRRKWLGNSSTSFISADPYFSALMANNVNFFDPLRKLNLLFAIKDVASFNDALFDSDRDLADLVEFDEVDEEYFDQGEEDNDDDDEQDEDQEDDTEEEAEQDPSDDDWIHW
jgi:hypothetical protein